MKVPCGHCGVELDRFPSRMEHCPRTFCGPECKRADKSRQVDVACAICGKAWTVKASRASQNKAITCGPECLAEYRKRTQLAHWASGDRRMAQCHHCGKDIIRKPSQLAKYPTVFCNKICKNASLVGEKRPEQVTGEWVPCDICGRDVWRTPATRLDHVYCSRACGWKGLSVYSDHIGPYAPGFTPTLKRQVQERDGNACRVCGVRGEDTLLHTHHIDGGKVEHNPENLITLCASCHRNVHVGNTILPPISVK